MNTLRWSLSWLVAVPFLALSAGGLANANEPPVVGAQPLGVTVEEAATVAKGWSGKKDLLNKAVFNDKNEKIGSVQDVIIGPEKTASFAIVGTGGFVGLAKHDVAIPFSQLQLNGSRVMLPGATKDALKSLPEFVYAR